MRLKTTTVNQYKNYIQNHIYKNVIHIKKLEQNQKKKMKMNIVKKKYIYIYIYIQ